MSSTSKYDFPSSETNNIYNGTQNSNQLDYEFDQHLANMKKYILELKERKSKQLCALWIKKLCETSSENNDSHASKSIRNEYSSKLFYLLENYMPLKFPFNERPQSDNLLPYNECVSQHFSKQLKEENDRKETNRNNVETITLKHESEVMLGSSQNTLFQSSSSSLGQPFDYHLKLLEGRFKEEKLNLQQYHSNELQKILDKKNGEIDNLKINFNRKKKEYEDNISELERKVQNLSKQIILDKDSNERNLNDLKYDMEKIHEKKQFEYDKKLNEMLNKYEKEKFEMKKQHTKAFQDLVEETNIRLKKVENEYNQQQFINDKVIHELENRTQLLKAEMEKNISLAKSLEQENKEKQVLIESLEKRLNDEMNKNKHLTREMDSLKETQSRDFSELNSSFEAMLNNKIKELESYTKKANILKEELSNLKSDYEKKVEKLTSSLKEKETALSNANNTIKQQKNQAEMALNELKNEIEKNSNKLYEEMKNQMNKVENDLEKSKSIREKQSKDFTKQVEQLKVEHRKEIEKLNSEFNNEKHRIFQSHEYSYNQLQNQYQQQLIDITQTFKLRGEELNKKISVLDQELIESNALRKQQITELGILREDEKNKLTRNKEIELESIRHKYENELNNLKKKTKEDMENLKNELKTTQKQSDERSKILNDKILDLEEKIKSIKNENKKLKESLEKEKNEYYSMVETEKNSIKKSYSSQLSNFEKELELEKNKCKSIEKKIKQISYENEQYILNLKMHYEERLKGLLPLTIKNDYEETICALRSQVESLQQRTMILQSELDDKNQMANSTYTPSI